MRVVAALLPRPPASGDVYASKSGKSYIAVSRVRRSMSSGKVVAYHLFGMRLPPRDLPAGASVLPWPRKPLRAASTEPAPILKAAAAQPPGAARSAQRAHAKALLADDRDSNRVVHQVRIANATAIASDWRDPDDTNPNRRVAKVVHGYRTRDSIETLLNNGSISKTHARAARRFRRDYELGDIGLRASPDLTRTEASFFAGAGPSEVRLRRLEAYQAASSALGPRLQHIVVAVIIRDDTLVAYGARMNMNRTSAAGYLLACLDRLVEHYEEIDKGDDGTSPSPAR